MFPACPIAEINQYTTYRYMSLCFAPHSAPWRVNPVAIWPRNFGGYGRANSGVSRKLLVPIKALFHAASMTSHLVFPLIIALSLLIAVPRLSGALSRFESIFALF